MFTNVYTALDKIVILNEFKILGGGQFECQADNEYQLLL